MSEEHKDTPPAVVKEDPALDSFEERLAGARKAEDDRLAKDHAPMRAAGTNKGWQVASTMLGYPLGGIIIGFALDKVFDTAPWIMIVLMFVAFAGACLHVVRSNQNSAD